MGARGSEKVSDTAGANAPSPGLANVSTAMPWPRNHLAPSTRAQRSTAFIPSNAAPGLMVSRHPRHGPRREEPTMSTTARPPDTSSTRHLPVIVVGAGMAGLTCAVEICRAGRDVLVLESSDGVGGRVRTDRHPDGFLLDRGFQVLLDGYPAVQRQIDLEELHTRRFDTGALVWTGKRLVPLANPFRHPSSIVRDVTTSLFGTGDKVRLAALASRARLNRWQTAAEAAGAANDDQRAAIALWSAGFSPTFVDRFARPFWGGILLDQNLSTSAGPLRFTLKMFLQGHGVLPACGMQAMPDYLAGRLPLGVIRVNRTVDQVLISESRVSGVRVGGESIPAAAVVVATDPPTARRLTGIDTIPTDAVSCTTVYLTPANDRVVEPPLGKRLTLDGTGTLSINHLAPISAVAPAYAPPGKHLIAAVLIGDAAAEPDDEAISLRARDDAARTMGHAPGDWRPLATVRVPFSQFTQPPGIYGTLPDVTTSTPGLYLASEATVDSSYNGAITSGERAAAALLRQAPTPPPS